MKKLSSRRRFDATQLMVLRGNAAPEFRRFGALEEFLGSQDLLVMNLSGTIPGSFWAKRGAEEPSFEVRLAAYAGDALGLREWWAISLGRGDWHLPTEERGPAPPLKSGDRLEISPRLWAEVRAVDSTHPRLFRLSFLGENFLGELYRSAHPIQYSYQEEALALWDVQTPLAQLPLSVEAPSALFPFNWDKLLRLKKKYRIAFVYHGAGISSTGDPALDQRLPLPEFFSIPEETVRAWRETRARGGRVIAIGTSVARALESAPSIAEGAARSLSGVTTLRVTPDYELSRVDGMLTGYHDPLTSHFELEAAVVGEGSLRAGFLLAEERNFQRHEFGDVTLLLRK